MKKIKRMTVAFLIMFTLGLFIQSVSHAQLITTVVALTGNVFDGISKAPVTATIKKEINGFFICVTCDNVNRDIQNQDESQVIGVDMGVKHFCIDSNGEFYLNHRIFKK